MTRHAWSLLRGVAIAAPLALPVTAGAQSPGPSAGAPVLGQPAATGSITGGMGVGKTTAQMAEGIMSRGLRPRRQGWNPSHRSLRYREAAASWSSEGGVASGGGVIYEQPPSPQPPSAAQPPGEKAAQPPGKRATPPPAGEPPGADRPRPTATGGDASSGNIRDERARPAPGSPGGGDRR